MNDMSTMNNSQALKVIIILLYVVTGQAVPIYQLFTAAGNGAQGSAIDGSVATSSSVRNPEDVSSDNSNNIYFTEYGNFRFRKVSLTSGITTVFAGDGSSGISGNNGPATSAKFTNPKGISWSPSGNVFTSDADDERIRKIAANNIISIYGGTGSASSSATAVNGDKGAATSATINGPYYISCDSNSNLFISDQGNNKIRRIDATTQIVTTVVGTGGAASNGDGGRATSATINNPNCVFVDSVGKIYLTEDTSSNKVRVVNELNIIRLFAGLTSGSATLTENVPSTSSGISRPMGLWGNTMGDIFFCDNGNKRIRIVSAGTGLVTNIASSGVSSVSSFVSSGPALSVAILDLTGLSGDENGRLFAGDWSTSTGGNAVRAIYESTQPPTISPTSTPTVVPTRVPSATPSMVPSSIPTVTPSRIPSVTPTISPTSIPSVSPTLTPTISPTTAPTSTPTTTPSTLPSIEPSVAPSVLPSMVPSVVPSIVPSIVPTVVPTVTPSNIPTSVPSAEPSNSPSEQPTITPTTTPSNTPTVVPTVNPTVSPTAVRSNTPSTKPTMEPSSVPTVHPTVLPTVSPTVSPTTEPTTQPSMLPSNEPSWSPSSPPSETPSCLPSVLPSAKPTLHPTVEPTITPSITPSSAPSSSPSVVPSVVPSAEPTLYPTIEPTITPSSIPTTVPSVLPTLQPSAEPSVTPSLRPSITPSQHPSHQPSISPTMQPTSEPSCKPTTQPTVLPTVDPTVEPSSNPSIAPSILPSRIPTNSPSEIKTIVPSPQPSQQPTLVPTTTVPSHIPSSVPSTTPSILPTLFPTTSPSVTPSKATSKLPSQSPSHLPTTSPSDTPTRVPTSIPTLTPSIAPTTAPSSAPTTAPTLSPTSQPTDAPSRFPSVAPTIVPSQQPSRSPTETPSIAPSQRSTILQTLAPSVILTSVPTISQQPSAIPSVFNTISPTTRTVATLPSNHSISVIYTAPSHNNTGKNLKFKIVLPYLHTNVVSGNGFSDVLVSESDKHGENVVVVFGNKTAEFSRSQRLAATLGVSFDYSGRSVSNAGDINGDGYDDLIIGVPYAARCYVLFGTSQGFVNMTEGFTIFGAQSLDLTGWSVSGAGDVNNDTFADIIIGAPLATNQFEQQSGLVYVIFGRAHMVDVFLSPELTPQTGIVINGAITGEALGVSVSSAGDVNGDGYDDIIMGALKTNSYYKGGAYVLFGAAQTLPNRINTSSIAAQQLGLEFLGAVWSWSGYSVSGAGDVNGDGFDDLLIGSVPFRTVYSPQVSYLVYGSNKTTISTAITTVSLSDLTSQQGVVISGGGVVVSGVGDINHDGYDDIMIGYNYGFSGAGYVISYPASLNQLITATPTSAPTFSPSRPPTTRPSRIAPPLPTVSPSSVSMLTMNPSTQPTVETGSPIGPTIVPSQAPIAPTFTPTISPIGPTISPTLTPTQSASVVPSTITPTISDEPSTEPTFKPSPPPTRAPVFTRRPLNRPTTQPTIFSTTQPTSYPTNNQTTSSTTSKPEPMDEFTATVIISGLSGIVGLYALYKIISIIQNEQKIKKIKMKPITLDELRNNNPTFLTFIHQDSMASNGSVPTRSSGFLDIISENSSDTEHSSDNSAVNDRNSNYNSNDSDNDWNNDIHNNSNSHSNNRRHNNYVNRLDLAAFQQQNAHHCLHHNRNIRTTTASDIVGSNFSGDCSCSSASKGDNGGSNNGSGSSILSSGDWSTDFSVLSSLVMSSVVPSVDNSDNSIQTAQSCDVNRNINKVSSNTHSSGSFQDNINRNIAAISLSTNSNDDNRINFNNNNNNNSNSNSGDSRNDTPKHIAFCPEADDYFEGEYEDPYGSDGNSWGSVSDFNDLMQSETEQ